MTSSENNSSSEEAIGKLIAAAGKGSTASPEAKQRIYEAVHARWRSEIGRSDSAPDDDHGSPATGLARRRRSPRPGRRREFHSSARFRTIGIAATVALAAVTVFWLQGPQTQSGAEQAAAQFARVEGGVELVRPDGSSQPVAGDASSVIRFGDTLRTSGDGRVALRMSGGLLVRVNIGSELIFTSPEEIDLLTGTIYVDTGDSGADNPLQIDTELGRIEHLGTQYEVRMSDSALRVRVREGSITYNGAAASEIGQAGEQLDIVPSGLAARSSVAPNDPDWEWATALATLPTADRYRVDEVLNWVARELGLQLDFSSLAVEQRLSGQIVVGLEGLNPTETLDVIQRTTNFDAAIAGEQLLISN